MPGLVPGIHVLLSRRQTRKDVDGRDKPGHDGVGLSAFGMTPPTLWLGLMALGGLVFGLAAERRPFGEGIFAHPLVAFFILVGLGLLALRVALARPVPDVISERMLLLGCFAGVGMFLIGNWFAVHVGRWS
jgi:hypothetical protein